MFKGSCLCRSVQYQASELIGPYVYCHCESCRKSNGSAFAANISSPIDTFEISAGSEFVKAYESSPKKFRHFCTNCGSPLFTKVGDNPKVVRIRLGTLDTPFSDKVAAHIFVDDKAPWHQLDDATTKFAAWPDTDALSIPGSRQDNA